MNERESSRPGTLYNTLVYLGPSGLLARHRKLMPTQHESLFHGIGAGDDMAVVSAVGARVGGLICWENRMPLARYRVYRGGPSRLRLNGTAAIDERDELIDHYPGAQLVVRVRATQVFPNCPRYIRRMTLAQRPRFVPRADTETPTPDWKRSDRACDVLPHSDGARKHS